MAEKEIKRKRKWRDRCDGAYLKDVPAVNTLMMHMFPMRTDCEVSFKDVLDATELVKYLERKNAEHPNYKTTVFHCFVMAIERMLVERPKLNRFIQGHRMYQRFDTTVSFIAKRRFADGAEESLMVIKAQDDDTLDSVSFRIYGDVTKMRHEGSNVDGLDHTIDTLAKLPNLLLMFFVKVMRWMDFWGIAPKAVTEGDTNFSSVLCSNLGSIQCGSVAHHLNNYGTNSIMVTLGTLHKEELLMPDGHKEIRDVVDFCVTLDERIADGFYFARSLKLLKHIFANPEILDKPLKEPSGFTYE